MRVRQDVSDVSVSISNLAVDLYNVLKSTEKGNIFFSPYSISTALAMTYAGARETTKSEMRKVLHLPVDDEITHQGYKRLSELLESDPGCEFDVANALWVRIGQQLRNEYLDIIRQFYGGSLLEVDFNEQEKVRERINTWVEEITHERIKDLIPPGNPDTGSTLVLTNAIYFLGKWALQFNKDFTQEDIFHVSKEKKETVQMMRQTDHFNFAETTDVQILEMCYASSNESDAPQWSTPVEGNLSMVIVLPKTKKLEEIEKTLTMDVVLDWLQQIKMQNVKVTVPKFRITQAIGLADILHALGMYAAFSPTDADFLGISEPPSFFIGGVLHKAFIEVDEEGTEAAAATAVIMAPKGLPPKSIQFTADKPFLFMIRERTTGAILFIGRIVNPKTTE